MAQALILEREMRHRLLPPVCLRCGEPADDWVFAELSLQPRWVWWFLVFPPVALVLAAVLNRRTTIEVPMCGRHCLHWARLILMRFALLLGLVAGPVLVIGFALFASNRPGVPDSDLLQWAFLAWGAGMFALATADVVLGRLTICPLEIDRGDVLLTRLSERFVAALEAERRQPTRQPSPPRRVREGTVLDRRDAQAGRLPSICVRCGANAVGQIPLLLTCRPPPIGPWLGRPDLVTASMWAPVCGVHGEHWNRMRWCRIGFFVAAMVAMIGLWIVYFLGLLRGLPFALLPLWIAVMLLWYVADRIVRRFPVRAVDIDGDAITLVGVAPAFAKAIREWESESLLEGPDTPDVRIRR
jgi:hypothetical protein